MLAGERVVAAAESDEVPAEKIIPVMPSYAASAMSMEQMQSIIAGKSTVPTCSIGVGLTSVLAGGEAINLILKRRKTVKAPEYTYVDVIDQKFIIGSASK